MENKQEIINELNKELDKLTVEDRALFFIDWYGEEWFYDDMYVWREKVLLDALEDIKDRQSDKYYSIPYMEICKEDVEDEIEGEVTEKDLRKIAAYMSDELMEFWSVCKENAIEERIKDKQKERKRNNAQEE